MTTAPSLATLEKGFRFAPFRIVLDPASVRKYRDAIRDVSQAYDDSMQPALTPPLAVATFALREMLAQVRLPSGALHSGQEILSYRGIPEGSVLTCHTVVSQRSVRSGMIVLGIEFEATERDGGPALFSARTSVILPPEETS